MTDRNVLTVRKRGGLTMRKEMIWARRIKSPVEAPSVFRPFLEKLTTTVSSELPYTVFAPADRFGRKRTNPKILCLREERFTIMEATRDGLIASEFPYAAVDTVEIGYILLSAWFKISGVNENEPFSALFEYNTVADRIYRPAAESVRAAAAEISWESMNVPPLNTSLFDDLINRDYKYMNFAKMSLIPGEEVLDYVYQPEVRARKAWRTRILLPAGILILTGHELILIQEAAKPERQDPRYGGSWRHIPLRRIAAISLANAAEGKVNLMIEMGHGKTCSIEFDVKLRHELENLLDCYRTRSAGKSTPFA